MLAIVMGLFHIVPLINTYRPEPSICESVTTKGICLDTRIDTPFVLVDGLVAWKVFGKFPFESLGIWSVLKCVSWSRTISALIFFIYSRSCALFSGTLSPFAFRETILSLFFVSGWFVMGIVMFVVCHCLCVIGGV